MRSLIFAAGLIVLSCHNGQAAERSNTPALPAVQSASDAAPVAQDAPVPVPTPSEMAIRHYRSGNVIWCLRTLWELAVPAAFLFSGLSARLRDFARRIGRKWYFVLCLYFVLLALLNYVIELPLDYYQGFIRPHAYGLSNQTFQKWFSDSLKELAMVLAIGALFLWVPYLLIAKIPRRWWIYAGLAMLPIYFFVQLVRPVWIDPLFNKFGPMEDKALEARIIALAEKAGIHGSRVYEVNKSIDTKTVNAYVTGFLGTKRIVLWDTIIQKLDEPELLFVMGHEMGHYALGHVVRGILCLSLLTFVAFYGIHRVADKLIPRHGARFGFSQLSDVASLPLIVLLFNVFSLVLTPIGFAYSRHLEHEADRFGVEITHFNHAAATGFVKLQEQNLSIPRPGRLYVLLRATHPSNGERIDFFNDYKPWEKGEPSKYAKYFQTTTPTAP
jgi:Zn-dependent protease with chaperone function